MKRTIKTGHKNGNDEEPGLGWELILSYAHNGMRFNMGHAVQYGTFIRLTASRRRLFLNKSLHTAFNHFQQALADCLQTFSLGYFLAATIGYVENIDHLVE